MTNTKNTKRALLSSVVALVLCFSMLLGTTYAWFTDSVTSSGNIIQTGILDVELHYAEGSAQVPGTNSEYWTDAENAAIYKADQLWEPGYIDAKHIKITNNGNLALKYQLAIIPHVADLMTSKDQFKLADVIDVYLFETATQVDRASADNGTKLGSIREVMNGTITTGALLAGENRTCTIVLKMREEAGNEYQGLKLGSDFSIQLIATQYTYENDSFGDKYDEFAEWPYVSAPVAIPEIVTAPIQLKTQNKVDVEIPVVLIDEIKNGGRVTSMSLACSEPKFDSNTNTVVFDSIEILDQDGQIVDLENNANTFKVTLPAQGIANGTNVVIYHDGAVIGSATVVNGYITYEAKHFCKVEVKTFKDATLVDNVDALKTALKTKNSNIVVLQGTYDMGGNFSIAEGTTLIGVGNVVLKGTLTSTMKNLKVANITFESGNAQRWAYASGTLEFENCTFKATSVYALHFDGTSGADITYKNCTMIGWCAITGGHNSLTFDGCKISGNGTYGVIRTYGDATIKNCTFDVDNVNTNDVYQDGIHAVDCTITVENCTNVNGVIEDIFNVSGKGIIAFEGVQYVYTASGLQNALDNAVVGNNTIVLAGNIAGVAKVSQKDGVNITIDGRGFEYAGSIEVNGNARFAGTETLTIKNINFVSAEKVDFISAPSKVDGKYNYSHNITVDNCTFTAPEYNETIVGVQVNSSYNLKVTNCIAINIHSLMQAESCKTTVTVDNCRTINCKSGVSFNNTENAIIKNSDIESVDEGGYGVRVKAECEGYSLIVEDCTIEAFVPVLVRNATATYTATMDGSNNLLANNRFGYDVVVTAGDWDSDAEAPAVPTGKVDLNGFDSFNVFNG